MNRRIPQHRLMFGPERHDRVLRLSEHLYRWLLLVYPREFRRRYGAQMEQVFRDLCREERRRGRKTGLLRLWGLMVLDLIRTAIAERSPGSGSKTDKGAIVNGHKPAGIGLVLVLAPLYFVGAAPLKNGLGVGVLLDPVEEPFLADPQTLCVFDLVSPVVFLGGACAALALNAYSVFRLNLSRRPGALVGTVRVEAKPADIAVAVVSFLSLITLVGYVLLENVTHR